MHLKPTAADIEEYRYALVEFHDWWDSVEENFNADMGNIGICVDKILFSGFSSQGDGACFEGSVADWGKYLVHLKAEPPTITALTDNWSASVKHRGHYSHELCTSFDFEFDSWNPHDPQDEPLQHEVWDVMYGEIDFDALETQIIDDFRSHMRALYRALEAEYEHLTSDEVVSEWLVDNDILTKE